jgi:hypothetical protein
VEEAYEDFARQPLLPNKLSQLGPGVSWFDVDGDGREELLIGSGKGGALALYQNNGQGGLERVEEGIWTQTVTRDQTAVLGLAPGRVLVGSANYEDGLALGGAVKLYDAKQRVIADAVAGQEASLGPMALGDGDGDGDLDLFVGGRVVPGRYGKSGFTCGGTRREIRVMGEVGEDGAGERSGVQRFGWRWETGTGAGLQWGPFGSCARTKANGWSGTRR